MSDDLVKRLRNPESAMRPTISDGRLAADRIEKLEANALANRVAIMRLEAKLAKAVEALDEAIYLLDPDDEDIAKETGLYRIVKIYEELKGEM